MVILPQSPGCRDYKLVPLCLDPGNCNFYLSENGCLAMKPMFLEGIVLSRVGYHPWMKTYQYGEIDGIFDFSLKHVWH